MRLPRRTTAVILLLINTICWGAALPLVKPALDLTTPFQHLFSRYVIACLLTLPVLIWYLYKQPELIKSIGKIVRLETIGTVLTLSLVYEGLARTSALEANIITTAAPVFIITGGVLFLHEKQSKREWIGLFTAILGTLILVLHSGWNTLQMTGALLLTGNILLVLQNVSEAGFLIMAKKKYAKLPKLFVTIVSFWVGLLGFALLGMLRLQLTPTAFFLETWNDFQQPAVAFAALYMAVFGSIVGLTAYIAGQNLIEASEASIFRYLQPLIYIPLAVYFLGESFNWITGIALGYIFVGVVLAEYQTSRTKKARRVSPAG
jgi:drug/metabolite transporter (DMT)-like permease